MNNRCTRFIASILLLIILPLTVRAATPTIDSVGSTALTRSGFIEVVGSGFGLAGELLVDGQPAILASWSDTRISGYVPETVGPGSVPVLVSSGGMNSNSVQVDVSLRQPDGRFIWRVRMDSFYSQVRPAVGPDGTIYAVDVSGRLYAVSPGGGLLWLAHDAGSKGVDVAADGTIYTGTENWVKAFNPDGSEKWTFTQNPRAFILIDVAEGPDGNVYGVASSGMGVFSLTPEGVLRWTNPEAYTRPITTYSEIAFGPGPDGQDQLYFYANGHVRAVRLADGASMFIFGGLSQGSRPVVSTLDETLHFADKAYSPAGFLVWQFQEFLNGLQAVSNTGVHYNTNSQGTPRIYAVEPDGSQRWQAALQQTANTVDVDPFENVLVLGSSGVLTSSAAVIGVDTANGATLWRAELPVEDPDVPNPWTGGNGFNQFIDSKAEFSADGKVAYLQTAIAPGGVVTDRAFLYAVFVDPNLEPPSDYDSDGVVDNLDNCIMVWNADQRDTNGDRFGNICDGDLNNDGLINFIDLAIMKSVLFTGDPDADMDGDGLVNFIDLGLMKASFFDPPGPSGLVQ